jgi:hypothetical protein
MWVEAGGASKIERNFNNHMRTYSKTLAHHAQLLGTTLGSSWPQSREFAYNMLWNGWSLGTTMRRYQVKQRHSSWWCTQVENNIHTNKECLLT